MAEEKDQLKELINQLADVHLLMHRDEFVDIFGWHEGGAGAQALDQHITDETSNIQAIKDKLADPRCQKILQSEELKVYKESLDKGMELIELEFPGQPKFKHYGWVNDHVNYCLKGFMELKPNQQKDILNKKKNDQSLNIDTLIKEALGNTVETETTVETNNEAEKNEAEVTTATVEEEKNETNDEQTVEEKDEEGATVSAGGSTSAGSGPRIILGSGHTVQNGNSTIIIPENSIPKKRNSPRERVYIKPEEKVFVPESIEADMKTLEGLIEKAKINRDPNFDVEKAEWYIKRIAEIKKNPTLYSPEKAEHLFEEITSEYHRQQQESTTEVPAKDELFEQLEEIAEEQEKQQEEESLNQQEEAPVQQEEQPVTQDEVVQPQPAPEKQKTKATDILGNIIGLNHYKKAQELYKQNGKIDKAMLKELGRGALKSGIVLASIAVPATGAIAGTAALSGGLATGLSAARMVQRGLALVDTVSAIKDIFNKDMTSSEKVKAMVPKIARIGLTVGSIAISSGLTDDLRDSISALPVVKDFKNLLSGAKSFFGISKNQIGDAKTGAAIGNAFGNAKSTIIGDQIGSDLPTSNDLLQDGLGVGNKELFSGLEEYGVTPNWGQTPGFENINNFMESDEYQHDFEPTVVENAVNYNDITLDDLEQRMPEPGVLKNGFTHVGGNPYQISTGIANGENVVFTFDPNTKMISSSHGGTRSIAEWMARSDANTNTTAQAVIDAFKRFAIDKDLEK